MSEKERTIIVFAVLKKFYFNTEEFVFELKSLTETAGGKVVDVYVQKLDIFNPATLVGKGKLSEIKGRVRRDKIDLVIFGNNLSPLQHQNIENYLDVKVIDRTELILDIFAQHARSREGKIQVELAQLRYRLTQLTGRGREFSRLGGGIGTRGPGETKLEVDRRRIKEKITKLQNDLQKIRRSRKEQKKSRVKAGIPHFAIIGYTNVGKSSLLNFLTKSNVLVGNKLFATLDPTTRRVYLGDGITAIISDTVGFIENLPDDLFEAFRATLEEIENADYLILMIDASSFDIEREIESVYNILQKLDASGKVVIHVFNKIDLIDIYSLRRKFQEKVDNPVFISVKEKRGIDDLRAKMKEMVKLNERISDFIS